MYVAPEKLATFTAVAFALVCTPGPNMIYLVSRSVLQGRLAGIVSLAGVICGFIFYMFSAAVGLTALVFAVPFAYELIQWAGVAYLLWLAWNAVKPGAKSVLEPNLEMPPDGPGKLFMMGFVTNLLNPKIALLYLSLLPQFIEREKGTVFLQSLELGLTQIVVSASINFLIVICAGSIARWFSKRPAWLQIQRWLMASVLTALAVRLALSRRTA
jgi:threonine/homoserine/homoserine lactone efflux protein